MKTKALQTSDVSSLRRSSRLKDATSSSQSTRFKDTSQEQCARSLRVSTSTFSNEETARSPRSGSKTCTTQVSNQNAVSQQVQMCARSTNECMKKSPQQNQESARNRPNFFHQQDSNSQDFGSRRQTNPLRNMDCNLISDDQEEENSQNEILTAESGTFNGDEVLFCSELDEIVEITRMNDESEDETYSVCSPSTSTVLEDSTQSHFGEHFCPVSSCDKVYRGSRSRNHLAAHIRSSHPLDAFTGDQLKPLGMLHCAHCKAVVCAGSGESRHRNWCKGPNHPQVEPSPSDSISTTDPPCTQSQTFTPPPAQSQTFTPPPTQIHVPTWATDIQPSNVLTCASVRKVPFRLRHKFHAAVERTCDLYIRATTLPKFFASSSFCQGRGSPGGQGRIGEVSV